MKKAVHKKVEKWKSGKAPAAKLGHWLPLLTQRGQSEVCPQPSPMPPLEESSTTKTSKDAIKTAVSAMVARPIFPTLITSVNVKKFLAKDFCERLASMAVKKYTKFSDERKRGGQTDANDINDGFFGAQSTGEGQHKSGRAQ